MSFTFQHLEEASSLLIVLVKDILKQFFIIKIIIILPLFIIKEEINYAQLSPLKIEFINCGLQLKKYHSMKRI